MNGLLIASACFVIFSIVLLFIARKRAAGANILSSPLLKIAEVLGLGAAVAVVGYSASKFQFLAPRGTTTTIVISAPVGGGTCTIDKQNPTIASDDDAEWSSTGFASGQDPDIQFFSSEDPFDPQHTDRGNKHKVQRQNGYKPGKPKKCTDSNYGCQYEYKILLADGTDCTPTSTSTPAYIGIHVTP